MDATMAEALRVYLVEDDQLQANIIGQAIREIDPLAEVLRAADGESALAFLRQATPTPDLILLDINMPGLSGFEVLTAMRAAPQLARVPVVMLTSSDSQSDIARAYELGASGFISKPSYLHDVRAVLANTVLYWAALKRTTTAGGMPL